MSVKIIPGKKLAGEVNLTPSKSISNRVLLIDALSEVKNDIRNLSHSTDTEVLTSILKNPGSVCDAGDAGTAFRFLTAYLATRSGGEFVLTGSERMKVRPCGPLVESLNSLGCKIGYQDREGYPPLKIRGMMIKGGKVSIDANISSQFTSALLLIGPSLQDGISVELTGKVVSKSYLDLTADVMRMFGAQVSASGNVYTVNPHPYQLTQFTVENDWSSASYWYLFAACSEEADLVLKGISLDSKQGDSVIAAIAEKFGVISEAVQGGVRIRKVPVELPEFFPYDFTSCPDLVMTMAVMCAVFRIQASFTGVKNLRIKESNRLIALQTEMSKAGVDVHIFEDELRIDPSDKFVKVKSFSSHNDHRMVMSFSAFSFVFGKLVIDDPAPVKKSYPEFLDDLRSVGITVEME